MSTTFTIKRGDTLPALRATLTANNIAFDLTTATEVKFYFKNRTTTLTRTATVVTAASGITEYVFVTGDWITGQFDTGTYSFEAQVTFTGGAILTAPTTGQLVVRVEKDLA